jgi:hypothetical protein
MLFNVAMRPYCFAASAASLMSLPHSGKLTLHFNSMARSISFPPLLSLSGTTIGSTSKSEISCACLGLISLCSTATPSTANASNSPSTTNTNFLGSPCRSRLKTKSVGDLRSILAVPLGGLPIHLAAYPTVLSFRQIIQNLGYDITYTVVNWNIVCRDHLLITLRF